VIDRRVAGAVHRAHAFEKLDQLALLRVVERTYREIVGATHLFVELLEHVEALPRDVAEDLTPIGRCALAASEPGLLELVEQACDAGRRVDHAVANDQGGETFFSGAAQDSKDVVLLDRHASAGDDLREIALDEGGGA